MKRLILVCALGLAACQGGGTISTIETKADPYVQVAAEGVCRVIGASLKALAPFRQRMSAGQVAIVEEVTRFSDRPCLAPEAPDTMSIVATLTANAVRLKAVQTEVK